MKREAMFTVFFLGIMLQLQAQTPNPSTIRNGFGFGAQIVQYQNDFGIGINVVTPYFAQERIALRLRSNLMYNQNIIGTTESWVPYANLSLGLIGVGGYVHDRIRLYGEGGVISIFPSSDLTSDNLLLGGYGLFGFEFFFNDSGSYFIEIGGMGGGAVADKISSEPIYSRGLTLSAGVRFFLN